MALSAPCTHHSQLKKNLSIGSETKILNLSHTLRPVTRCTPTSSGSFYNMGTALKTYKSNSWKQVKPQQKKPNQLETRQSTAFPILDQHSAKASISMSCTALFLTWWLWAVVLGLYSLHTAIWIPAPFIQSHKRCLQWTNGTMTRKINIKESVYISLWMKGICILW